MIQQTLFKKGGTDKIIAVLFLSEDGRFQLNAATPVQHMAQSNAANACWQFVRHQPVQKRSRARARHLYLCKGGHINDAHSLSYRFDFCFDHVMNLIAAERILIPLGNPVTGKPARAFKAEDFFMNSPFRLQHFM